MTTVQLALADSEYAQALRGLLLRDGTHQVLLVDRPDLNLDGVVVIDRPRLGNHSLRASQPERFVVITSKTTDLKRIWDAGVSHVVFEDDSPDTALLAVIAAELRLMARPFAAPTVKPNHFGKRRFQYHPIPAANRAIP